MVVVTYKQKTPGGHIIILEEQTNQHDIWNTDPATGRWGVRTGVFKVTDEWLETTNLEHIILNTILSHDGNEEDRIIYPDGAAYIDPFGMYVYSTSELGHKIAGRRDKDLRYDISKEIPRELVNPENDYQSSNESERLAKAG